MFDLNGKLALVTGSVSGLGQAMAIALAGQRATVLLNGRDDQRLEQTRQSFADRGLEALTCRFDTSDRKAMAEAIDDIEQRHGQIDILINNVGFRDRRDSLAIDSAAIDRMFANNLNAPFELARRVAPGMMQQGWGRIINVSSVVATYASNADAAYVAAKGGLEALTRALAVEYGKNGVTVNAISPGFFLTEPNREMAENEALNQWLESRSILGRWAEPEELAGAAVFLASDESGYITGQTLQVDGGISARL